MKRSCIQHLGKFSGERMRLFITGGSGLLGSKVAEIAMEKGYEVFCGYNTHFPEVGIPVRINLLDRDFVRALKDVKPEVIVHSAALTDVDKCEIDKEVAYRINVEATKLIADFCRKNGSHLIYVSTDYVFDGQKGYYKEDDEPRPINYYGYTKFLAESFCKDFCIARTCVIYGSKPASGKVNFALWLIKNLEEGKEVKVVTDQFITPTLNTNLANMLLEIAERKLIGIFHLAGSTRVSRFDFAVEIAKAFDLDENLIRKAKMDEMKWVAKRPRDSSLDVSKAKEMLKEKPMSLKESLLNLFKEYRGV